MDVIGDVRDAAIEQLYDELLARTWAVHEVLGSVMIDVARRDVTEQLAAAAGRHVAALAGDGEHQIVDRLLRVLWPSGTIPAADDPWWATPLGRLITTAGNRRCPASPPPPVRKSTTLAPDPDTPHGARTNTYLSSRT